MTRVETEHLQVDYTGDGTETITVSVKNQASISEEGILVTAVGVLKSVVDPSVTASFVVKISNAE